MRRLHFDRGTLVLSDFPPEDVPEQFVHDPRTRQWRAPAIFYHQVVLDLFRRKIPYDDQARGYEALGRDHQSDRVARPYQQEAVDAWVAGGRRGCIVLPTGSGKSFVAELCIANAGRDALVVAPTIDLVGQWYDQLRRAFGEPVGLLGGGSHDIQRITVSTYDSAYLHMERYGSKFGLVVFDEVHHLPGPSYGMAAQLSIAPFRLGLTATLERPDESHTDVFSLVGPVNYQRSITELSGDFLADYHTECLQVHLSEADREAYQLARGLFRSFVDSRGLRLGGRNGWQSFLRESARSQEGRQAFKGWLASRRILQGAPAKLRLLDELLRRHADGRCIVFTNDNATVYEISRRFLLPAITHQTPLPERRALLAAFAEGSLPVMVTSRVLNEGVDVPAADVAIVLSGTSTVREHVQRLGRILRPKEGKKAVLYELVVADSTEERVSERRRQHEAYE
jgi:superfamily II DNA or RNA helicase